MAGSIDGAFVPSSPDWLRTAVRRRTLATSGAVLAQAFSSMYLDDDAYGEASRARDVLKHLTCPVLSLCSNEAAAEFCRSVPGVAGSQSVLWAGTSHFLHVEHPGVFVDLVVGWVEDWA